MEKLLLRKKDTNPSTVQILHSRKLCTFLSGSPPLRTRATGLNRKCNQYATGGKILPLNHLVFLVVSLVFNGWAISPALLNHLKTRERYLRNTGNTEATVPTLLSPNGRLFKTWVSPPSLSSQFSMMLAEIRSRDTSEPFSFWLYLSYTCACYREPVFITRVSVHPPRDMSWGMKIMASRHFFRTTQWKSPVFIHKYSK